MSEHEVLHRRLLREHDLRFTGDGWRWQASGEGTTWADLVRVPFTKKVCVACLQEGPPDAVFPPCDARKETEDGGR